MGNLQDVARQLAEQAGSVVIIVALLRLAVRRLTGGELSGDALLGVNLAANAVLTFLVALAGHANLADTATLGGLALVALGATVGAHGFYDLVASRAKGSASVIVANGSGVVDLPEGADAPTPGADVGTGGGVGASAI